jgi:hypothetical protein
MSNSAANEKTQWEQVMENLDLLFTSLNDMGTIQQEVKQQLANTTRKVEQCTAEQKIITEQVKANGQAVAQALSSLFANLSMKLVLLVRNK